MRIPVLAGVLLVGIGAGVFAAPQGGKAPPAAEAVPPGYVKVEVTGVVETEGGKAVVLRYEARKTLLPIWIGEPEAFAIQLRLNRQRFNRPLTHDLLEAVMLRLGGELVRVQVDDLKDNTFVGTLFVRQQNRVLAIDARPSDCIALAVGAQAPIFVAERVLASAGLPEEKAAAPAAEKPNPDNLLKDILDAGRKEHTL